MAYEKSGRKSVFPKYIGLSEIEVSGSASCSHPRTQQGEHSTASISGSKVVAQVVIFLQQVEREESEEHTAPLFKRKGKLEVADMTLSIG